MQYINRYRGSTTRILPSLNGKWHSEAMTEGLKFIKCRKFTVIGGVPSHRREKRADAVASAQVVI